MNPLTIFVVPSDAVGHMNACTGTTRALAARGHRVIYLTEECFKGTLTSQGFEEHIYSLNLNQKPKTENGETNSKMNPIEKMARDFWKHRIIGPYSVEEKMEQRIKYIYGSSTGNAKLAQRDVALKEAIQLYNPDVFLVDKGYLEPAVAYSGKPWIRNNSFSPIATVVDDDVPPPASGYPSNDRTNWAKFHKILENFWNNPNFNDNIEQMGYPRYAGNITMPETDILTIYAYPEELNYPQIRAKGWFNLEVFDKRAINDHAALEDLVPDAFLKNTLDGRFSGKLVYLSLGTIGSVDVELMNRLVKVLGSTTHKYIVSKGPRHDEFHLPQNMFGDRFVPQTKIVPHVDLVMSTHGGNNTFTETFALGKPMIVMPLLGDQYDNAQRIHEMGYGIRLDPYQFEDQQLSDAVNCLLYDEKLNTKLRIAAKRIQASNAHELLCDKIESLLTSVSLA